MIQKSYQQEMLFLKQSIFFANQAQFLKPVAALLF